MNNVRIFVAVVFILVSITVVQVTDVLATNGYFSHGYGTQSKALAGAGVALPQSAMISTANPAGIIFLENRYDISLALFRPDRQYTIVGDPSGVGFGLTPGTVESDSKLFLIPAVGINRMIGADNSVGFAIYGNGGMNTNYNTKTYDNPMADVTAPSGVNLMQIFFSGTYARKLSENHAVGFSAIFSYQRFKAEGLQAFGGLSSDATRLTDNNHDNSTGFGFRVGYLGKLMPGFSIGGSFQSQIFMSEFSEYAGLFAEKGDFDIPATWTAGLAYQINPKFTAVADVQQIFYNSIKSIANPMDPNTLNPAVNPDGFLPLGSDDAAGFGWKDMTIFKLGLQWNAPADFTLRTGYSYGEQPIPEGEMLFNILAPGVMKNHITFGASKKLNSNQEISIAVMHSLSSSVSGPNTMEIPNQQEIELQMSQWDFEIGFGF